MVAKEASTKMVRYTRGEIRKAKVIFRLRISSRHA